MAIKPKDEQEKVVTPFEDADFRNKSLDAGNIIDRRQFEQNLIRYGIFTRLTALEENVSGLSGDTTIIQQTINNPSSSTCYWHKIGNDVWYTAGDVYAGYAMNVVNKSNTERDPIIRFSVGDPLVAKISIGVDDSDSDSFKIEPASSLGGSDYIRYLDGVLQLQDSTSAPTLEIINLSDTARDPVLQFAVGATPVIKYTLGVDDSSSDDLCLTDNSVLGAVDGTGGQLWRIIRGTATLPTKTIINHSLDVGDTYGGTSGATYFNSYSCDTTGNRYSQIYNSTHVQTGASYPEHPTGVISLYTWCSDATKDVPAQQDAIYMESEAGLVRISAGFWGSADYSWLALYAGDLYTPDDVSELYGHAGRTWWDGVFTFRSDDYATELRFEETGTGTGYVGLIAPAAIGTSFTLTLPTTDATGTQALVSNGSGALSWSTIPASAVWSNIGSNPQVGEYRIKAMRLDSTKKKIVVMYDDTPEVAIGDYETILSNPLSGEYRIKALRLDAAMHLVVVYDSTPEA